MTFRPLAAALVLATALTSLPAAPAHAAEPEDIAKILGGAATLFIVGKAIQNARRDDERKARDDDRRGHGQDRWRDHDDRWRDDDRWRHDDRWRGGQRGRRDDDRIGIAPHRGRVLPAACFTRGYVRGQGEARVFGARCLERTFRGARHLPEACLVRVATDRGRGPAYEAGCLRRYGYRLDR